MIQLPESSDLRSLLITKDEIDVEIRRLKKLKEDSERETERWLREMEERKEEGGEGLADYGLWLTASAASALSCGSFSELTAPLPRT